MLCFEWAISYRFRSLVFIFIGRTKSGTITRDAIQPLLHKGSETDLHLHLSSKEALDQGERAEPKWAPLMEGLKTDPDDKNAKPALDTISDTPV